MNSKNIQKTNSSYDYSISKLIPKNSKFPIISKLSKSKKQINLIQFHFQEKE